MLIFKLILFLLILDITKVCPLEIMFPSEMDSKIQTQIIYKENGKYQYLSQARFRLRLVLHISCYKLLSNQNIDKLFRFMHLLKDRILFVACFIAFLIVIFDKYPISINGSGTQYQFQAFNFLKLHNSIIIHLRKIKNNALYKEQN